MIADAADGFRLLRGYFSCVVKIGTDFAPERKPEEKSGDKRIDERTSNRIEYPEYRIQTLKKPIIYARLHNDIGKDTERQQGWQDCMVPQA